MDLAAQESTEEALSMRLIMLACCFCSFVIMSGTAGAAATDPRRISLQISGYALSAEVAATYASRAQGLMFREHLDESAGMLFVFPKNAYYGMWMKNTMIPLSVAFIDEKGFIINIADMQPHTLSAYYSAGQAKYALEMNIGWFSQRKINAGDQVVGLELVPVVAD
ncbi:hypothetical protein SAMN05421690_101916 [Nitrosomonas sp. Nm51]|uniref:DUF192 domain-containing protein n=1 Tax=Nitrosomonas sp. Nm51 TaxID=133720 RepID=UPI0008CFE24B|nr:DUF192 domain-containing protein [Nitrosomonas sp. Nm51]SER32185.1 hypothetical protein SAMN05421690_101916 [Nitrosomonas sp. Nm51]